MFSFLMIAPVVASVVALPAENPSRQSQDVALCAHARAEIRCMDHAALAPIAPPVAPQLLADTDVLHYNLNLEIVPATHNLIGTNIITVKCLANGVTIFPLQLHQNFTITSMQVNGVNVTYTRLDTANLNVNLDHVYNANDQFDLTVAYSGVPVSVGFGSINFTTQSGNTLIFTLSEPYYAYTWWPVKEDNTDKATGEMAFTVPNTLNVISNGLRQGVDILAGSKLRYRWKTSYPTSPYLYCFSASNYTEFTDTWVYPGANMLMQFFIFPASDTQSNRNAWLATKQMLTTYSDLFGMYPFASEKYGIYQFTFGGGMEHQTMTGQGTFSNSTTAHELGHQWFGDKTTCAAWGHIWLNEGFATYCEALWQEFQPGSSGTPALLSAMAARRPGSANTVVFRYDTSDPNIIFDTNAVYYKGGWVLHMLRHIVGDDAFFQILHTYSQQFAYQAATTEDLQSVAESVTGQSFATYFNQWVYQPGQPQYQTAFRNISAAGKSYVELYIKQVQSVSYPTYEMPIDIVTTTSGVNTTNRVWNDERAEHLLFQVSGPISALQVDPNNYILRSTNQTTTFVEGPPKIVAINPAIGSSSHSNEIPAITVTFHKNVNASAGQFSLVGNNTGAVPFSFSYSAGSMTATLTPNFSLPADTYTLTISDSVTDTAASLALDGEISNPDSDTSLPSGDGLAGGAAAIHFIVLPNACAADVSTPADGMVNVNDLLTVINSWGPCTGCAADVNHDNVVNVSDLLTIINAWGPCP